MEDILKHLLTAITAVALSLLLSITCFAADNAQYEITWTYSLTNTSDAYITALPFGFDTATYATDSAYQPDTKVTRAFTTSTGTPYIVTQTGEHFKTNIAAGETQSVTFKWTFSGGDFDQRLQPHLLDEPPHVDLAEISDTLIELSAQLTEGLTTNRDKALAIYKWVTANIVYGEKLAYALPETATCVTFATVFHDMLTAAGVPDRKVIGYTLRLVDKNGALRFGDADITGRAMHEWNEYYDEILGWTLADPTFDAGGTEFRFFGKCPAREPHLAMYYGEIAKRYVSTNPDAVWTKTATLRRSEYVDEDTQSENLLEVTARTESEKELLTGYADALGLSFTVNRFADEFSLANGRDFNIPPGCKVTPDDFGDLNITGASVNILLRFNSNGAFRLYFG
jgi:hypothetical protein